MGDHAIRQDSSSALEAPPLGDLEVHVWSFSLEVERGQRRATARVERDRILGRYLDRDPESLKFTPTPDGKPRLADDELEFNVSHSGPLAVMAVARSLPLGIDLEARRTSIDLVKGIRDRCSEREGRAVLAAIDPHDEWVRLWARKEAVVKADGVGVLDQLAQVDVLEDRVRCEQAGLRGDWRCIDLEPDPPVPGLHLALATPDVDRVKVVRLRA